MEGSRGLEEWQELYERYRESGETQREFCRKEKIIFSQFKTGIKQARAGGLIPESGRARREQGEKALHLSPLSSAAR